MHFLHRLVLIKELRNWATSYMKQLLQLTSPAELPRYKQFAEQNTTVNQLNNYTMNDCLDDGHIPELYALFLWDMMGWNWKNVCKGYRDCNVDVSVK